MKLSRSEVLRYLAGIIDKNKADITRANQIDLLHIEGDDHTLKDRLKVDEKKVDEMIESLNHTADKEDPDGKILYEYTNVEGLLFRNVTVPFGTILIIYESRPDVTIEAGAMAFKSGNKIFLKGGKEARNTNLLLVSLWHEALEYGGYSKDSVRYLDMTRNEIQEFISSDKAKIDLIIPRGGDALIQFVLRHALSPVIVSGRGNNFVYVHHTADTSMATRIIANGKSRLSVCNATDKVLIDKNLPKMQLYVDTLVDQLNQMGLDVYGDHFMASLCTQVTQDDSEHTMYQEYLSPKIHLRTVDGLDDAIIKINTYSGGHSATIIAEEKEAAESFMHHTDCAAVYHNASTRFTDGGQVGFGGEMAISTQKLHFRGPVGMAQLVTNKWMVYGCGHTRE